MNAIQLMARLRQELRESPTAASWTDYDLVEILNRATESVGRDTHCVNKTLLIRVVDGVERYPILQYAPDFLGLRRADWQDKTLHEFNDIDRWNLQANAFQAVNSTYIRRFGIEGGSLVIFPTPTVTEYTGATVTVTRDDPTVAVTAGTPATNGMRKGYLFGVGASPTKWYSIRNITDATIELSEPYREETAAGQASVLSSGALRIRYSAVPPKIRILDNNGTNNHYYTKGKIDVTVGGYTMDEAAAPGNTVSWGLQIRSGMDIGVGTPTGGGRPKKWYSVRTRISATQLRIWQPYELETVATNSYVLCDSCPFDPFPNRAQAALYLAAREAWAMVGDSDKQIARLDGLYKQEIPKVRASVAAEMGIRNSPVSMMALDDHFFFGGRVGG